MATLILPTYQSSELIWSNITIPTANTINNTSGSDTAFDTQLVINPDVWAVGKHLRIHAAGLYGTILTPTITGKIKLAGGSTVTLGNTSAIGLATGASNLQWRGELHIIVMSVGSSATLEVQGSLFFVPITSGGSEIMLPITNTSLITIDTTVQQTLSLTANWSASSTSNTIQLRQLVMRG